MTAPARPPVYADAIAGRDDVPPEEAVPWLIGNFISSAMTFPDWVIDEAAIPVALRVTGPASVRFAAASVEGELVFSADPSGWIVAVATIGSREVFRAYVERNYEEYEVWPPDAGAIPVAGKEPGRIGKHATWVSLNAAAWPVLRPVANPDGWVNIVVDEDALRRRLDRDAAARKP